MAMSDSQFMTVTAMVNPSSGNGAYAYGEIRDQRQRYLQHCARLRIEVDRIKSLIDDLAWVASCEIGRVLDDLDAELKSHSLKLTGIESAISELDQMLSRSLVGE
jgi:hypothetical protein